MSDTPPTSAATPDGTDDVQFCSFCSESFPADDPMVDYDGQTFCSPDCVREMLGNEDPCDHATYVGLVRRFDARLARIIEKAGDPDATD